MILHHLAALPRIGDLDLPGTFVDPIEEELGRRAADPRLAAKVTKYGAVIAKRKVWGFLAHDSQQEPAAVLETQRRQAALLHVVFKADRLPRTQTVLDDFQVADRLARGEREADISGLIPCPSVPWNVWPWHLVFDLHGQLAARWLLAACPALRFFHHCP